MFYLAFLVTAFANTAVQGIQAPLTSLDPVTVTNIEVYNVLGYVVEPLAKGEKLEPILAKSWRVEGSRLFIELKNFSFHDGSKLTADDIKYSVEANRKSDLWRSLLAKIESITIHSPTKLEVKFKEANFEAVKNLLTAIRIFKSGERRKTLTGTGPFKVKRFKNERLYLEGANLDLLIRPVADAQAANELIRKGELDFFALPEGSTVKSEFKTAYPSDMGTGIWIELNLRRFPEKKMREALLLLWNRKALNQKVFHGKWELAEPQTDYNPKKAAKLLAALGWKDQDKNSILERRGTNLEFTMLVRSTDSERWASLYQQDAAKIGVKVNLKRVEEDAKWWSLLKEGKFEAVASGGPTGQEAHFATLHSKGEYNYAAYSNRQVDLIIEKLNKEFDPKKRRALHAQVLKKARQDLPQIPGLILRQEEFLISPRLHVDPEHPRDPSKWRLKN